MVTLKIIIVQEKNSKHMMHIGIKYLREKHFDKQEF